MATEPITFTEIFGLDPAITVVRQGVSALLGSRYQPPTRWGLSMLRMFKPEMTVSTWLGRRRSDRRLPIYNLFNRVRPPKDEGYSVRVTYARDFLGGRLTYDGHNGTDFAVPVGTPVAVAAPGRVVRVANDFTAGGLKVCIDHGDALFTTYNHLSRASVRVGDDLVRGDELGLSGASGMEFLVAFPLVVPHLHFNVWLNGEPVDPFAQLGEVSFWRRENDPVPHDDVARLHDREVSPSRWSADGVLRSIDACRDPELRARMRAIEGLPERAAEVLVFRNYRAAMFDAFPPLYEAEGTRRPVLDLPFLAEDFVGVAMPARPRMGFRSGAAPRSPWRQPKTRAAGARPPTVRAATDEPLAAERPPRRGARRL
jgi:murein DD-endopeptidase